RRQFGAPLTLRGLPPTLPAPGPGTRPPVRPGRLSAVAPLVSAVLARASSRAQRSAETPEQLPEQFGRYRIIKRPGHGGMGSVSRAQATHLERAVALKIPDFRDHDAPEARRRFLEEARTVATLRHPYLCPVYDAREIEGQPYLTMAYIKGQSLAALIGEEG